MDLVYLLIADHLLISSLCYALCVMNTYAEIHNLISS